MRLAHCLPLTFIVLAGCAPTRAADVSIVLEHGNCQHIDRGARLVDFAEVARLRGAELIGMQRPAESAEDVPELVLVAVSLGPRPTLGYRLRAEGEPRMDDGVLTIRVADDAPPAGAVVGQMVTQPCIVFGVSGAEVRSISVEDGTGDIVGTVTLPTSATP
jgi:hypothetical protein